jgi:pyruvate formate lyase activating enzyme
MIKGRINKIIDSSVVDGPGNRTVIFFQGCNFNCTYCHNPETITHQPDFDISHLTVKEVVDHIKGNKPFITGITTSGGECTLQKDFLIELFKETRKLGLTNYVDTNGSLKLWEHPELVEYTDAFMLDIKAFSPNIHVQLTSKSNETVIENALFLAKNNKLYEIRTVVIDGLDNRYTVDQITKLLKDYGNQIRYKIIRYRSHGVRAEYRNMKSPSEPEMNDLKMIANQNAFTNVLLV